MPTKRVQQVFSELSFEKKLVGAGSLLMFVSIFLPWYQDLDSFKTGDMYLGITGPLYLAGFSMLLLAGANIAALWMDVNGNKMPFVPFKHSSLYLFSGVFAFYMLMIVNSIYFHQKFGLNITMKQSQFGMFFAFISASFLTVGGYLAGRDKASLLKEFQDEAVPFIKSEQRKSKENLRSATPKVEPVMQEKLIDAEQPVPLQQPTASVMGSGAQVSNTPAQPVIKNQPDPTSYQPYRTDL